MYTMESLEFVMAYFLWYTCVALPSNLNPWWKQILKGKVSYWNWKQTTTKLHHHELAKNPQSMKIGPPQIWMILQYLAAKYLMIIFWSFISILLYSFKKKCQTESFTTLSNTEKNTYSFICLFSYLALHFKKINRV